MPEQEIPGDIDLSGDGGVLKTMLEEGTGVEKPHDGMVFDVINGQLTNFHEFIR